MTISTDSNTATITHGRAWIQQDAGVRLGYTVAATSPNPTKTVVMLHGAPQTRHAWRHVLIPLADAGYRVIAPDYRGAGDSTKPSSGYDKWTMAGDIHYLVHDVLGVEGPVSLVGHDVGSMLALGYALRYRDDVLSVTFMEAPLPGTDYYDERKVAKSAWHFDFHSQPDIAEYLTQGKERWYVQRFYDDLTYQPRAITDADVDAYARAFEAPGAMRALFEIYRELDNDAQAHRAALEKDGKLTVPVLASGGGAQALAVNYLSMCEDIAENVRGELIPECGHWVAEEQPEHFTRLFLDFDTDARSSVAAPHNGGNT